MDGPSRPKVCLRPWVTPNSSSTATGGACLWDLASRLGRTPAPAPDGPSPCCRLSWRCAPMAGGAAPINDAGRRLCGRPPARRRGWDEEPVGARVDKETLAESAWPPSLLSSLIFLWIRRA